MNLKATFIFSIAIIALNTASAQSTETAKKPKTTNLFISNGGAGHYVKTGQMLYAGIMVEDTDGKLKVANVDENYTQHFEDGDIILSVNKTAVGSRKEWNKALKQYQEGDKVEISIERGSKRFTVSAVLRTIDVYKSVI